MVESQHIYIEAIRSLPNPEPPQEYKGKNNKFFIFNMHRLSTNKSVSRFGTYL